MFSVIIPLFNKVGQIKDAVNSVLAQSNADFELIVVDDGSTDGSYDVVASFTDPRIRTVRQKNGGVSVARNTGVAQASGEYICFLDADDLWCADHLECLKELIAAVPHAGLYATLYQRISPDGKTYSPTMEAARIAIIEDIFAIELHKNSLLLHTNSICIPRNIFRESGGFVVGEQIGEDTALWYRIAAQYSIAIMNQVTSMYRTEFSDAIQTQGCLNREWSFLQHYQTSIVDDKTIAPTKKENISRFVNRYYQSLVRHELLRGERSSAKQDFKFVKSKLSSVRAYLITCVCFLVPQKILKKAMALRGGKE